MWEARSKAANARVNKLEHMRIAYDRGSLEGVKRHLHKVHTQRARYAMPEAPPPEMPPFNFGPRKSLYELRPSALHMVEEYGFVTEPSLDELREMLTANYDKVFGRFRRRGDPEVPSGSLKKQILVERLIGLIGQRRKEYAGERQHIAEQ